MRVGIIGAMAIEVELLKQQMQEARIQEISGITFYIGILEGIEVSVAVAGVGKVNAAICAQTMILRFQPDVVINVGVAGGLDETLHVGDIVIADSVVQHDMDTTPFGDPAGYIPGLERVKIVCTDWVVKKMERAADKLDDIQIKTGVIATGDQFISTKEKKGWIRETFSALAAEMEGASIGQVCEINRTEFCVVRAISDGADDGAPMSFEQFTELAAHHSLQLILNFLREVEA